MKIRACSSGLHLFSRDTGLNILLDEVQVPRASWSSAPRWVSIALTNDCDLTCPHCFAPKQPASLDMQDLKIWIDELDANGCMGIGFGGGEPALYPNLAGICSYTTRNTKMAITLTTNAIHFNNSLIEDLSNSVNFIRVSMDGIGSTYEFYRGISFKIFLQKVKSISNSFSFGINYIVNSVTFPDLDSAIEIASDIGASEFLLLPEQPVHGKGGIDGETSKSLQNWANKYTGSIPLTVSELGSDGLPTCNPFSQESGLNAYAHIDASGNIKRLSFDQNGVPINKGGIIEAIHILEKPQNE